MRVIMMDKGEEDIGEDDMILERLCQEIRFGNG